MSKKAPVDIDSSEEAIAKFGPFKKDDLVFCNNCECSSFCSKLSVLGVGRGICNGGQLVLWVVGDEGHGTPTWCKDAKYQKK